MATAKKTRKRDPYANKTIAFDSLSKSMERNAVGTIGFFLTLASVLSIIPYVGIIFALAGLAGLVMSIIGLFKKPNGLPFIGLLIAGVGLILNIILWIVLVSF